MANDLLVPPIVGEPIVDTGTVLLPPGYTTVDEASEQPGVIASGFGAGRTGLTASAGSFLELAGQRYSSPSIGGFGARIRKQAEEEGKKFRQPATVDEALESPSKFIPITAFSAGNLAASLATSIGSGSLLGLASKMVGGRFLPGLIAGAAGTSLVSEVGETYQLAREAGASDAEARALKGGPISAALDFASLLIPAGLLLGKKVGPLPFRLAAALIASPLVEGVTESAQDAVKGHFASGQIPETKHLRDTMITTALGAVPTFGLLGAASAFRKETLPETVAKLQGQTPAPFTPQGVPTAPTPEPVAPEAPAAFQPLSERPTLPVVPFEGKVTPFITRPAEAPVAEETFLSIYGRAPLPAVPAAPTTGIGSLGGRQSVKTRLQTAPVELDFDGRPLPQRVEAQAFKPFEFEALAAAGIPEKDILRAIQSENFGEIAAIRRKAGLLLTTEQAMAPALKPRPLEVAREGARERVRPVTVEELKEESLSTSGQFINSFVTSNPNLAKTGRAKALSTRLQTLVRSAIEMGDINLAQQLVAEQGAIALKGTMPKVDQEALLDRMTQAVGEVLTTKVSDPRDIPLMSAQVSSRTQAIDAILESLSSVGQPIKNTEARNAAVKYVNSLPEEQRAALKADPRFVPELTDAIMRHLGPNRMLFSKSALSPAHQIVFHHWGRAGNWIDPKRMGTGVKGRDQAVNLEFSIPYISAVVAGSSYVEPEVQAHPLHVGVLDADKVYNATNLRADPLFIKAQEDIRKQFGPDFSIAVAIFQKAVVAAGYDAILYPNGQLRIFKPVFTSPPPTTESLVKASAAALVSHNRTKWSTTNLVTGKDLRGQPGYIVGLPLVPRRDFKDGVITAEDIRSFVVLNETTLANPSNALNTWFDHNDGEAVLSVGTVVPSLTDALVTARKTGQIAILDLRTGLEIPVSHPLFDSAQVYNRTVGLPPITVVPYVQFDPSLGRAVAEAYDLLEKRSSELDVSTSYEALARETEAQYAHASAVIKIEPWAKEDQPYANSGEMRRDVFENGHLFVFANSLEHPFMTNEQNFKFRAVHDLYAHAKTGFEFGAHGELNATRAHAQMFSEKAIPAMLTETTGQNAWVNFGKVNEGKLAAQREYAPQKADLLPALMRDDILRDPANARKTGLDMVQRLYAERGKEALFYMNKIVGTPGNLDVRLEVMDGSSGYFAQALAEGGKNIIALAYNSQDIISATAHEGFHYLEQNTLNDGERGVTERAFRHGTPQFNKLMEITRAYDREHSTNLTDEVAANPKEARAYGFQFWRLGQMQADGPVARVWQKLRAVLERVMNYFEGNGFTTYEDIFAAIDSGYYAVSGTTAMNKVGTEDLLSQSSATYPGAPDWVETGQDLRALRRRLATLALEGANYGRYWHEDSSRAILELMGGDRADATQFAKLLAIFSPRTTVPLNFKHAWTAWNQFEENQPIWAGVFPVEMSSSAERVMRGTDTRNEAGEIIGGRKRNNLFANLMIEIDPLNYGAHTQGGTIDMWMAHAAGYGDKDGKISQSQYTFVEENARLVAQRLGWPIHQMQAATWVATKARMDATRTAAKKLGLSKGSFKYIVNNDRATVDLFGEIVPKGRPRIELRPEREQSFVRDWIEMALKAPVGPENFRKASYNFQHAINDLREAQGQGRLFSRAALDAVPAMPQEHMTMLDSNGFELYYSKAALSDQADQYTKGGAQHMQMLHRVSAAVDEAGLPQPTWDQIFKHTGDSASGSTMRWVEKNLMSLLKISERSKGVANVSNVLFAHSDRKKRLIADSVEKNMSEWLPLTTTEADRTAVSDALMRRTVGGFTVGSPEYVRVRGVLSERQRRMFDQAGEMIKNMLGEQFTANQRTYKNVLSAESTAYKNWEATRRAQIDELNSTGYIPERRYGDFVTHGYIKTDRGPLTVFYTQFQSQKQAQDALDHLQKALGPKFPEVTFEWGTRQKVEYDGGVSYLDFLDTANRLGIQLTQVERERLAKFTIESDSTRRNRIFRRLNVPGFSTDGERILAEFAVSVSNEIAHSEFSVVIADAMQGKRVRVGQDAAGRPTFEVNSNVNMWAGDGPLVGHYRNLAEERVSYVLNPAHDKSNWSSKLRSLAALHFLGGSFAAMMVQLTQLPLAAVPFMLQYSGVGAANARVFGGLKTAVANYAVLTNLPKLEDKRGHPVPDVDSVPGLRDALIMAARDGTILDTELFQIMGMARGSIYSRSKRVQNAIKVWMAPFRAGEHMNRLATFIAGYKTGQELSATGKLPTPTIFEFAKDAVYKTQFRYDEANRPGLAHSDLGSILFVFKSFPIYMIEMISGLYKQSPKAAAYALMTLWIAAGTEGLPFMSNILDIIDVISQRLFGSTFNSRRALRNIAKDASEAVVGADLSGLLMTGAVNALTGMQFSSRLGVGDIVPGTRLGAADASYERVLSDVLGPVGAMIEGALLGARSMTQGEFSRAATEALPVAARNMFKGYDYFATGQARDKGGRKIADVGHPEAFWQAFGFSSASVAEAYAADRLVKQDAAFYVQVRQQVYDNIVRGIRDGKEQDVKDAFAMVQAWNDRYPSTPLMLDARSIRRSVALAGLPLNQRTLLMLPRALRSGAQDELLGPT